MKRNLYKDVPGVACRLLLAVVLFLSGCNSNSERQLPEKKESPVATVTIGFGGPMPALLALAAAQGYFVNEGLDVRINDFLVGKNAFEALLAGNSDLAVLSETPVVVQSFTRNDFVILSTLRSSNNQQKIAARRDHGVSSIADLRGRRIAVSKATSHHYFLDLMLAKQGLTEKNIEAVFLEAGQLEPALAGGSVDAFVATNQITGRALQKLADKGISFEEPGLCLNYSLLVTTREYAADNRETLDRFFRALYAAELFKNKFPDKSRMIIMTFLKLSREAYDVAWGKYNDKLALDSALLLTLEEHAGWVLQKGFVAGRQVPNYLNFIDAGLLRQVAAEGVRLQR